ncbi:ubiquitin-like small modifier protein 1 [Haloarculaceae archaeon H-GB2-1]|nr:MoaD family protein [Haloarculaceae archaeon H-GB1-1]MEA5407936.1 ubiquitin-like small modifier protein 1 [Haloarculaceae archaeon H-GB2-1]
MSLTVELRFYAHLRDIVGQKTIERSFAGETTVRDVLDELVEEFPELADHVFDEDEALRTTLVVRKDRSNVSGDESVTDGDSLALTTQIVGGRV